MSDTDREFGLQCPWFVIGVLAYLSAGACVLGVAVAFGAVPVYPISSVAARVGCSCLLEALAVLFGFAAIRWTIRRVQRRGRLVFTGKAIVVTEAPSIWPRNPKSIPYAGVRKVRHTTFGDLRIATIVFAGGRLGLGPGILQREEDCVDLLDELTRRLEPFDVEVEARESFWYRPQFSLRSMLIVTAVVAALLGLRRWIDPEFDLSDLVSLSFVALLALIEMWLIFFARWFARIFAIGFVLGMCLDASLLFLAGNGTIPLGPYSPTMIICLQMLMTPGSPFLAGHFGWSLLAGMMISGTVGGTALLLVWLAVKRVIRRRRDTANSS